MKNHTETVDTITSHFNPIDTHLKIFKNLKEELFAKGKKLREKCPRASHGTFSPAKNRVSAIDMLQESEKDRIEKLLPLRHGRMAASPFTFYRGSAYNMAYDLSTTSTSGIIVQACGDAHLSNFGGFATPERNVIFSINDLDETLPAPWEWDVKRLATSFVIACENNHLNKEVARDAVLNCLHYYRKYLAEYSQMKIMELWYYSLDSQMMLSKIKDNALRERGEKRVAKERQKSIAEEMFPQLANVNGQGSYIRDQLPAIFHWEGHDPGKVHELVQEAFDLYKKSLSPVYQFLLSRFEICDAAIKVVGVGSVGTACWVILLMSKDGEPLFLQAKEARNSVLEPYAGKSIYPNHGQRVINGYRIIQPFSDPFLGWTEGRLGRHFFFRQLRDVKVSIRVEAFGKQESWAMQNGAARRSHFPMPGRGRLL